MSLRHTVSVMQTGMTLGAKQMWADKITIVGSFIIYAVIMIIYGGILKMIPADDLQKFNLTSAQLVWYIAITEYALFVVASWGFREVQNDFMSEHMHLSLLRPFRSSLVRMSVWAGEAVVRAACMLPPVLILTTMVAGAFVPDLAHLAGFVLSLPLSAVMMLSAVYITGASCLWFVQAEPASWVWYKSAFLLGALIIPLCFYPPWMQTLAWATPFPAILAFCGEWMLHRPAYFYALAFVHQLLWCVVILCFLRWFDGVVLRKIQSGEG